MKDDWDTLADMVSYPILINNTTLNTKGDFLEFMAGATIDTMFAKQLEDCNIEETLWSKYSGITLQLDNGYIWFEDCGEDKPDFKLCTLGGVVTRQ